MSDEFREQLHIESRDWQKVSTIRAKEGIKEVGVKWWDKERWDGKREGEDEESSEGKEIRASEENDGSKRGGVERWEWERWRGRNDRETREGMTERGEGDERDTGMKYSLHCIHCRGEIKLMPWLIWLLKGDTIAYCWISGWRCFFSPIPGHELPEHGHASLLHVLVCTSLPTQSLPPLAGAGLVQVLWKEKKY